MISNLVISCVGRVDSGKTRFIETMSALKLLKKEHGAITQKLTLYQLSKDVIASELSKFAGYAKIKQFADKDVIIADSPGHNYFQEIRDRLYTVSDHVLVFLDVANNPDTALLKMIQELKERNKSILLLLTKLDVLPGWETTTVLFKDSITRQKKDTLIYFNTRISAIEATLFDIGFTLAPYYTQTKDYQIPFCGVSAVTREGFPDVWLHAFFSTRHISEVTPYCILDREINNFSVQVGINRSGTIKSGLTLNGLDGDVVVKKVVENPYTNPRLVTTFNGFGIFGIISETVKATTAGQGLILYSFSKGSLDALAHACIDREWPISKAVVGVLKSSDILRLKKQPDPYNKILYLSKTKQVTSSPHVISNTIIYRVIEAMEQNVAKYHATKVQLFDEKYPICCLKLLKGFVFKIENPYVVGGNLLVGLVRPGLLLYSVTTGEYVGKCISIQRNNKECLEIRDSDAFSIKLDSKLDLSALLKLETLRTDLKPFTGEIKRDFYSILPDKYKIALAKWYTI